VVVLGEKKKRRRSPLSWAWSRRKKKTLGASFPAAEGGSLSRKLNSPLEIAKQQ